VVACCPRGSTLEKKNRLGEAEKAWLKRKKARTDKAKTGLSREKHRMGGKRYPTPSMGKRFGAKSAERSVGARKKLFKQKKATSGQGEGQPSECTRGEKRKSRNTVEQKRVKKGE